jgi:predicted DNA-binding transcriptional regulator YafY
VFSDRGITVRASRLVNLVLLLQSHGGMTAGALSAELGVSVRTIYRDLDALAAAGVPVYGVAGPGGGYRLVEGYRTRLTGLTAGEAEALLLVDLSAPLGALGLGSDLLAARLKLAAALPETMRVRAGELAGRVHLDLPGWFEEADAPPALPVLAAAVLSDREVEFDYGSHHATKRRVVEPLGLVLKGRSWYLVAKRDGRMLTYAVRRIVAAAISDRVVKRPDAFDLGESWRRLVGEFEASLPSCDVVARVTAAGRAQLPRLVDTRSRQQTDWDGEPDDAGWRRLVITFERLEHALQSLLGLGDDVEVLEPAELRGEIARVAHAVASRYGIPAAD